MKMEKEENAIILDYLPYGYPLEKKMMPIAQAIGSKNFTLLELVPRRGVKLEVNEVVYIGEGKREKIYYILGRLPANKLTETAKQQLGDFDENRRDQWLSFRAKFNHDMEAQRRAFRDFWGIRK